MCIVAMYTTTFIRLVHTNHLVFLGMDTVLLVVGVRLVPLGFTRLITLITLCGAIKRVSFTSNYLTLICQSGNVVLFQRGSQSEAIICQSNASSTVSEIKK